VVVSVVEANMKFQVGKFYYINLNLEYQEYKDDYHLFHVDYVGKKYIIVTVVDSSEMYSHEVGGEYAHAIATIKSYKSIEEVYYSNHYKDNVISIHSKTKADGMHS
jgi:hypothetical protein